jgi:hypothetical protein
VHTITITAVDSVGNVTTKTVTITIHATAAGLVNAVNDGFARGYLTAAAQSKLLQALKSINSANAKTKLGQFISAVQSCLGTSVQTAYGNLLLNWANDLLGRS